MSDGTAGKAWYWQWLLLAAVCLGLAGLYYGTRRSGSAATPYLQNAAARLQAKDFEGAIVELDQAIELDPNNPEAYNSRGYARANKRRPDLDGAIADYDRAIALKPDFALAYNNRGIAKRNRGDYADALADYDKAIQLSPHDSDFYANRAVGRYKLYRMREDLISVFADCDRALALNADNADAYLYRGLTYFRFNSLEWAEKDFAEYLKRKPGDAKRLEDLKDDARERGAH